MRFLAIDDEPELQAMVDYTLGVLETLGIENGCMHSEIKLEPRGPVLIEVNCRVHGGEGTWAPMAESCCGYSAVSALLDAYFAPDAFAALPALPGATGLNAFAMEAKLRSQVEGTLDKIDQQKMGRIRALKSYQDEMIAVEVGQTRTRARARTPDPNTKPNSNPTLTRWADPSPRRSTRSRHAATSISCTRTRGSSMRTMPPSTRLSRAASSGE